MSFKSCVKLGIAVLSIGLLFGCSGSTSSGANSNAVITLIANGVHAAGNAMHTSTMNKTMTSVCDEHGYPSVSQMDGNYPGHLAHCFMSVDTGDTVLGGFDMAIAMTCLMENAGVVYDGVARTITVDSTVAEACGLPNSKSGTMSALVTASSPASFNANYSHGVIIDVSGTVGGIFKIASNVDGTTSSFLTSESWADGSIGTTAGTMDTSTGDLWYESRVERNNCETESRCGWNRHTRIKASVTLTDGVPTGMSAMSFGYSNIQFTPGQNSFGGIVVSAEGDMTDGIKARLWQATTDGVANHNATAATDYDVVGNWVEVTNSACYTSDSETATTCGDGLALFSTNTKFLLNATDSHVSVDDWLNTITGQTFTAVNMDEDTQF